MGAGNAQIFAVFGHCAAGYVNALCLEHAGDQIIGQRLARIFFIDQFLDLALEQHQGRAAPLRPMDAFGEKETKLKDSLRGVYILAGDSAADGRRMHPDLFRNVLDHHRLESVDATLEKLALAADNRLAGSEDRVLALLDVAHQLQRRTVTLFDIILDVSLRAFLRKQFAIAMVETQGGQIFFIHHHDKLAAALDEGHIRLDEPGIGAVKSLPGPRIETANEIDGMLDRFGLRAQDLGHLAQVALLQQQQMLIHDASGQGEDLQPFFD